MIASLQPFGRACFGAKHVRVFLATYFLRVWQDARHGLGLIYGLSRQTQYSASNIACPAALSTWHFVLDVLLAEVAVSAYTVMQSIVLRAKMVAVLTALTRNKLVTFAVSGVVGVSLGIDHPPAVCSLPGSRESIDELHTRYWLTYHPEHAPCVGLWLVPLMLVCWLMPHDACPAKNGQCAPNTVKHTFSSLFLVQE